MYAVWADAPHQLLEKAMKQMVVLEARVDPERAHESWGLRPEHQALSKGLGSKGGYGDPADIPPMRTGTQSAHKQ